jgi:hypothetical protein
MQSRSPQITRKTKQMLTTPHCNCERVYPNPQPDTAFRSRRDVRTIGFVFALQAGWTNWPGHSRAATQPVTLNDILIHSAACTCERVYPNPLLALAPSAVPVGGGDGPGHCGQQGMQRLPRANLPQVFRYQHVAEQRESGGGRLPREFLSREFFGPGLGRGLSCIGGARRLSP